MLLFHLHQRHQAQYFSARPVHGYQFDNPSPDTDLDTKQACHQVAQPRSVVLYSQSNGREPTRLPAWTPSGSTCQLSGPYHSQNSYLSSSRPMSTAVDFVPHSFGRGHGMVDAMARHPNQWTNESPFVPRQGSYFQITNDQTSRSARLPPPPSLLPRLPPLAIANGRGSQHSGGRSYATPSPIERPSPHFLPLSDPNPVGAASQRGHFVDVRHSPALSSTASDRSDVESSELARRRSSLQMNNFVPGPPLALRQQQHFNPVLNRRVAYPSQTASPSPRQSPSPRAESKCPMKLSSMLNEDSSSSSSKAPITSPRPIRQQDKTRYKISVRQQPKAARSCGFGERDRRVIDPPPIVQLTIDNPDLSPEEIGAKLRFPFFVVHCSIWNEAGDEDNSAMPEDFRQQRRLMGSLVASPFVGQDENGKEGCFFCFPDLSCRTAGKYTLKFALVVLEPMHMRPGMSSPIRAEAMSDVFATYNAKEFPGMESSTPLTRRLKDQGCLISIKKGNDRSGKGGRDESSDGEDDDGESSRKGSKRQKKS